MADRGDTGYYARQGIVFAVIGAVIFPAGLLAVNAGVKVRSLSSRHRGGWALIVIGAIETTVQAALLAYFYVPTLVA